jgi:Flp pilus assembly protein TadD
MNSVARSQEAADRNQRGLRYIHLIFIVALALAPISLQGAQGARPAAEECLNQGRRHITQKQFVEAASVLRRCKQIAPGNPRPYFFSGIALAESGRLIEAASELGEAVRLAPAQSEYALSYANVLSLLKQKYAAVKVLARLDKKDTLERMTTSGLWLLNDIYMRLLKEEDALRILDRISQRELNNPRVHLQRGRIYKLKGNLDLAEASLRKVLGNPVTTAAAHYELGKILEQRKETGAAKSALLKAVQQEENNPEYVCELGSVCLALGEVDEAIRYLERAEASAASFPQIYYVLGQAYLKQGQRDKGAAYLKKVQALNASLRKKQIEEQEELTFVTLGEEHLDEGRIKEAESLFKQALTVNPKNWQANEYLAKIALNGGELERAESYVSVLEEIDAQSFEANFLRSLYWYQRQNYQQARDFAVKATTGHPHDPELRNLLGNIYLRLGLTAKAIEEFSLASRLAPDRAEFRDNLERARKPIPPPRQVEK